MKISKNARNMKGIAKAVSQSEKSMEKISMNRSKTMRVIQQNRYMNDFCCFQPS